MLHERAASVYEKYEEIEVMGTGSMGHVSKVKIKEGFEGGSAYRASKRRGSGSSSIGAGSDAEGGGSRHGNKDSGGTLSPATSNISSDRSRRVSYALKSIQLDRVSPSFVGELKNEIDILKTMDHPNIVRLNEVYHHKKQIYMILELCDGGDLYTRLPYTEKDAAYITGKLLSAIAYMHDHGIVHRDCKY
jgi:calcium-dependent protein kinase